MRYFAGLDGIEPSSKVLETSILPVNYSPSVSKLIFNFGRTILPVSEAWFSGCEN